MKFKIRKREIETKKGDYILFNGACYQFCTGDKRQIYFDGWHSVNSILLTKKVFNEIDFSELIKKEFGEKEKRTLMVYWFFK